MNSATPSLSAINPKLTPAPNLGQHLAQMIRRTGWQIVALATALLLGGLAGHQLGRWDVRVLGGSLVRTDRLTGKVTVWEGDHWRGLENEAGWEARKAAAQQYDALLTTDGGRH